MNKRRNRWGNWVTYGYALVMARHFFRGKRVVPKFVHFFAYVYLNQNIYVLTSAFGVLINLPCS